METKEPYPLPGGIQSYLLNQNNKQQMFQTDNDQPLSVQAAKYPKFNSPEFRNSVGCLSSYPTGMDSTAGQPYTEVISNYNSKDLIKKLPTYTLKNTNPIQNVPIPQNGGQTEGFANIGTFNDPTNDLLDIESRPVTDFVHNNMVPFYGSHVKQNMAGTGVKSGNYIDGVNVNSGFDNTTPYQDKLNRFTGVDDTYMHKREVGPMYSPAEQQMGWVYGTPDFRPDEDRYTQSLFMRNDMAPCEQEMVGPGLDISADVPASGGFHDLTRVLPNNVSNYKANQLQGRVKAGKFVTGAEEPSAYPGAGVSGGLGSGGGGKAPGVVKNRPNKFYSQTRRPTMTTKVGYVANEELLRPDYNVDKKPGNSKRADTNYGFGELVVKGTEKGHQFNSVPLSNYVN
jgi:hypothetical protein